MSTVFSSPLEVCKKDECKIIRIVTPDKQILVQHAGEGMPIPKEWIDDPNKDIWEEELRPWIEGIHASTA
jgi:hypothetical protein